MRGMKDWFAALVVAALALAGCTTPADPGPRPPDPVDPADPGAWAFHALDPCVFLELPGVQAVLRPTSPGHLVRPHACLAEYPGPGGAPDRVLLVIGVGPPGDDVPAEWGPPLSLAGLAGYQMRLEAPSYEWGLGYASYAAEEPTCHVMLRLSEGYLLRVRTADAGGDDETACAVTRDVAREVALQVADPAALVRRGPANPLTRWEACELVTALPDVIAHSEGGDTCRGDLPDGALSPPRHIYVGVGFGPEPGTPPLEAGVLFWSLKSDPVEVVQLPSGPAEQVATSTDSEGPVCAVAFAAHRVPDAPPSSAVGRVTVVVFGTDEACGIAHAAVEDLRTLLAGPPPALPPTPARLGVPFR